MPSAESFLQNVVTELFSPLYQLAVAITILYFLYGVMRYVIDLNASNADKQKTGRSHLLWGMVGLFIVLSVGGIFKMLDGLFGSFFN